MTAEQWLTAIGGDGSSAGARTQVNQYESGKKRPDIDRLKNIAKLAECTLDWLLEEQPVDVAGPEPTANQAEEKPPTETILLQLLVKHQELLSEQQSSVSKLTELLSGQQAMLARQQEIFLVSQQWQQRQAERLAERQQAVIDAMAAKLTSLEAQLNAQAQSNRQIRGRQQLFDSSATPGLAGEG